MAELFGLWKGSDCSVSALVMQLFWESPANWVSTACITSLAPRWEWVVHVGHSDLINKTWRDCILHLDMNHSLFYSLSTGSSGSNCSKNEGRKSGGSGSETEIRSHRAPSERSVAPPSERSIRSSVSHRSANSHSIAYGPGLVYGPPGLPPQPPHLSTAAPGAPPGRELSSVPPELNASRQSLRMAVGNAGEFFVDVM